MSAHAAGMIRYNPQGWTLREFHRQASKYHTRGLLGPIGSGKSQACIAEVLSLSDNAPAVDGLDPYGKQAWVRKSRGAIVRNTYRDLWDTTIKDWREWTDTMPVGHFSAGANGASPSWKAQYQKKDGSWVFVEVMFLAFDIEDDVRKIRGLQLSWVWVNEAKEMVQSNVNMLFGRTGRYPAKSKQQMVFDSNAPDRDHWLGQMTKVLKPEGWWIGVQPGGVMKVGGKWIVNPQAENLHNLPDDYYKNQIAGAKEAWIRQNLANEFVFFSDGRPVHPDFNEQFHVTALEATPGLGLTIGIDFGRTPAATIGQKQYNGQWYVLREVCTVNTSALTFGRILRQVLNEEFSGYEISMYGDPSGDQQAQTRDETPFQMLAVPPPEGGGLDVYPAPGNNDFEERVTSLDNQLTRMIEGQPAILMDESCVTLLKGLAGAYSFKRIQVSGQDRYHDKPVKDPTSHVCESLHYCLISAGEGVLMFDMDDMMADVSEWHPSHRHFE